ncbi:MAG: hypothetical protein DRP54_04385 [Spirochaetes bacterium]|nr:MAG: hypothetical protein DRP54_04385 [Spirochaetota bacterium]
MKESRTKESRVKESRASKPRMNKRGRIQMPSHKIILAVLIMAVFLSVPATVAFSITEEWPTYMGNQYLTGNNDGLLPSGLGQIWRFSSRGFLYNPVPINDRVYVVSTDKNLYCLDSKNGRVMWRFQADSPLTRMPVFFKGMLYLPAGRFLYCLDGKTGKLIWARRDPSYGFYGTPTIAENKIFYGNRKGFYARELRNGHLIWERDDIYTYGGFPTYWNGMVYTVSKEYGKERAVLYSLNANDGTTKWSFEIPNSPEIFSPLVYDGKLYLLASEGLFILNAETGEKIGIIKLEDSPASNPIYSYESIFIPIKNGKILRLNPKTENLEELFTASGPSSLAAAGSTLLIIDKMKRETILFDTINRKVINRIKIEEGAPTSLTLRGGVMFLTAGNKLYAFGKSYEKPPTEEKIGEIARKIPEKSKKVEEKEPAQISGEIKSGGEQITQAKPEGKSQIQGVEEQIPKKTITGKVKDKRTGKPLSGKVEAHTELESGQIESISKEFREGEFKIEIPEKGKTDIIVSAPGYTFKTITLPDEKAIDDLSTEPLELSLEPVYQEQKIVTHSIHFKSDSANLEPLAIKTLEKILTLMKTNPELKIEIIGHTDSTGPEDYNQRLSELRARVVADWLIRNGINSKRIKAIGKGESEPIADNSTPEGRAKNRRTEIRIIP